MDRQKCVVIGCSTRQGGAITGLPYIARLFAGVFFAAAGDFIRRRKFLTVGWIRRIFMLFSHVAPGLCLIGMTYAGCDKIVAVSMMILALAFNGAACQTNLQNHQDLAPNYAGTLYGTMMFFGTFPGFIIPSIVGLLTKENNGIEEWRVVFWLSAVVFISATVIFWFFGSADIQPWNDIIQSQPTPIVDQRIEKTTIKEEITTPTQDKGNRSEDS